MALSKAPSVAHVRVDEGSAGQRIDNFLVRVCKGVPKSHIYRILRSGEVRVNSKRVAQTYRLQEGDELRIPPIRLAEKADVPPVPVGKPFDIVFEDDALLVLDKPAGLAVHGGSGVSFGVIEQLRRQRPEAKFLELVHRLDRETSGLLIVAKKRSALTVLHDMMREGRVHKRYLTLVAGRWLNLQQHIKLALHKYLTEGGERRVREPGRQAGPQHRAAGEALAELQPGRGGTQDRAHPSDSRAPQPLGFPAFRRRQIRRLRPQQAARKGRAEAHVPARGEARLPASADRPGDRARPPLPAELEALW
jgi:23S rRNA-/tRNA-specific pseudouridylate synthase